MKRFLLTLVALATAAGLFAQVRIDNYPLPQHPDTLRILAVGNSFSDDGTEYLPGLLEAAGIHNVIVARLYIGGCTLERHCKEYAEGTANYIYYKSTSSRPRTIRASMIPMSRVFRSSCPSSGRKRPIPMPPSCGT